MVIMWKGLKKSGGEGSSDRGWQDGVFGVCLCLGVI